MDSLIPHYFIDKTRQWNIMTLNFLNFFSFYGCTWHIEVPEPGVESELQLPAYTTAKAMPDLSHICDLRHSLWQRWILNPLSEARDQIHILTDTVLSS